MSRGRYTAIVLLPLLVVQLGCIVTLGPEPVALTRSTRPPVLQLGTVTATRTGTWVRDFGAVGNPAAFIFALRQTECASLFSPDPTNLILDVDVTSDHGSDTMRLAGLGTMSILTLGLLPLRYYSEWNGTFVAKARMANGIVVAEYATGAKGTFRIWAAPPTMFTLFGASINGPLYGKRIHEYMANNEVAQLMVAVEADYERLAQWKRANGALVNKQPMSADIGGATYWVTYDIVLADGSEAAAPAGMRQYVLNLCQTYPGQAAEPYRRITVGDQAGVLSADAPWQWRKPETAVVYAEMRLWYPEWKAEGAFGGLSAISFKERRVRADELLRKGAFEQLPSEDLNELLISWKNRDLPGVLKDSSSRELRDYADGIEHMVLEANEAAESHKDEAQQITLKEGTGSELHLRQARVYEARIEILKPILAAVKDELAGRQR